MRHKAAVKIEFEIEFDDNEEDDLNDQAFNEVLSQIPIGEYYGIEVSHIEPVDPPKQQ